MLVGPYGPLAFLTSRKNVARKQVMQMEDAIPFKLHMITEFIQQKQSHRFFLLVECFRLRSGFFVDGTRNTAI